MAETEFTPDTIAGLPDGAVLIRTQDSMIQRIAVQHPRDEKKILERSLEELGFVPELAEENVYSIPYKEHERGCQNRQNCKCPTTYVQGLSVRAAENLTRRWGNCDVSAAILEMHDDHAVVVGVFLDYETMARRTEPRRVSRMEERRDGKTYRLSEARFLQKVAKECSIVARNASLKGLPSYLKARIFDRCLEIVAEVEKKKAAAEGVKLWETIEKSFKALGVERERIERLLGKPLAELTDEEVARLRVLREEIKRGERKIDDVFPNGESAPAQNENASLDDVLNAGTKAESVEEKDAPPQSEAKLKPPAEDEVEPAKPKADSEKTEAGWVMPAPLAAPFKQKVESCADRERAEADLRWMLQQKFPDSAVLAKDSKSLRIALGTIASFIQKD